MEYEFDGVYEDEIYDDRRLLSEEEEMFNESFRERNEEMRQWLRD